MSSGVKRLDFIMEEFICELLRGYGLKTGEAGIVRMTEVAFRGFRAVIMGLTLTLLTLDPLSRIIEELFRTKDG